MTTNDQLRELLEKATPGEWFEETEYGQDDVQVCNEQLVIVDAPSDHGRAQAIADARLIAAMHNELPRLLAESEELAMVKAKLERVAALAERLSATSAWAEVGCRDAAEDIRAALKETP